MVGAVTCGAWARRSARRTRVVGDSRSGPSAAHVETPGPAAPLPALDAPAPSCSRCSSHTPESACRPWGPQRAVREGTKARPASGADARPRGAPQRLRHARLAQEASAPCRDRRQHPRAPASQEGPLALRAHVTVTAHCRLPYGLKGSTSVVGARSKGKRARSVSGAFAAGRGAKTAGGSGAGRVHNAKRLRRALTLQVPCRERKVRQRPRALRRLGRRRPGRARDRPCERRGRGEAGGRRWAGASAQPGRDGPSRAPWPARLGCTGGGRRRRATVHNLGGAAAARRRGGVGKAGGARGSHV
jgi:hypothetical protein